MWNTIRHELREVICLASVAASLSVLGVAVAAVIAAALPLLLHSHM